MWMFQNSSCSVDVAVSATCISVSSKHHTGFVDVSGPRSAVFESATERCDTVQDMHAVTIVMGLLMYL